jgi:hypothetical protein
LYLGVTYVNNVSGNKIKNLIFQVYDEEENHSLPMFTSLAEHMPEYKRFQVIRKNSIGH